MTSDGYLTMGRLYRRERIAEAMCEADGHGIPWSDLSESETHAAKARHYRAQADAALDALELIEPIGPDPDPLYGRSGNATRYQIIGDGLWFTIDDRMYRLDYRDSDGLVVEWDGRDAAIAAALCQLALDRIARRGVHSAAHATTEG